MTIECAYLMNAICKQEMRYDEYQMLIQILWQIINWQYVILSINYYEWRKHRNSETKKKNTEQDSTHTQLHFMCG